MSPLCLTSWLTHRLLQAASSTKEEPSKTESDLTRGLSELYQRKSREEYSVSNQEDSRKKRKHVDRLFLTVFFDTVCCKYYLFVWASS